MRLLPRYCPTCQNPWGSITVQFIAERKITHEAASQNYRFSGETSGALENARAAPYKNPTNGTVIVTCGTCERVRNAELLPPLQYEVEVTSSSGAQVVTLDSLGGYQFEAKLAELGPDGSITVRTK